MGDSDDDGSCVAIFTFNKSKTKELANLKCIINACKGDKRTIIIIHVWKVLQCTA